MATSAKLQVSKCGRFAILWCSIGEYIVVWSKAYGRHMVESGVRFITITGEDAKMLLEQIEASPLPDSDALVGDEIQAAVMRLNQAHANEGYELNEEMIAEAIDSLEKGKQRTVH